jgi:hypothetical protein
MGRVFFNTRLNFHKITADYQALPSDTGKCFLVHPTATTAITLPTLADAGEGWYCKVVITEDTDGSDGGMAQIVNIDFGSGNDVVGIFTDGNRWYVHGMVKAAGSDVKFHTAAAS